MVGSLPLAIIFDVPNGFYISNYELHEISKDLDVDISINQNKNTGGKSIRIKTQERNASAIYAARFHLLKVQDLDQFVFAKIPESYKFQPYPSQLLKSGSDFNQEKVSTFDLSSDSSVEDPISSPTNPYFYPAPLGKICSYCGSKTNVSNAEQHCDSLCQARLVNMENFFKSSRPNRLPIFIEITSKDNKVSY